MNRVWDALKRLSSARAWVVGGAVRDWVLERPIRDVDLAVEGDVTAIGRDLASALDGHFFVMHPASQTARIAYGDGQWLDLVPLPHGLEADLRRRDFTINAMAAPVAALAAERNIPSPNHRPEWLVDPVGGWADARSRRLRMCYADALRDDPVRSLRALRLAEHLRLSIESDTVNAVRAHAHNLVQAAPERVRDEWLLTLQTEDPVSAVRRAQDLGHLDVLLPEWREMSGVEQNTYHHLDVWEHAIAVLTGSSQMRDTGFRVEGLVVTVPDDLRDMVAAYFAETVTAPHTRVALSRMAVLLHDAGKPATRTEDDEDGRVHFFGHEQVGAGIAREWCTRWKLSAREHAFITDVVGLHMRPGALATECVTQRAVRRFFRDAGHATPALLLLNVADRLGALGPDTSVEELALQTETSWRLMRQWFDSRNAVSLPLPVSGRDLMSALGLDPGPRLGRLLIELQEVHADTPFGDRDAALAAAHDWLAQSDDIADPQSSD